MKKALSFILACVMAGTAISSFAANRDYDYVNFYNKTDEWVSTNNTAKSETEARYDSVDSNFNASYYQDFVYKGDYNPSNPYENISLSTIQDNRIVNNDGVRVTYTNYDETSAYYLNWVNRWKVDDYSDRYLIDLVKSNGGAASMIYNYVAYEPKKADLETYAGYARDWDGWYFGNSSTKVVNYTGLYGYTFRSYRQ